MGCMPSQDPPKVEEVDEHFSKQQTIRKRSEKFLEVYSLQHFLGSGKEEDK